jgi:hypothetical protein
MRSLRPVPLALALAFALVTPSARAFTTTTGSAVWPDGPIVMNLQLAPNAPLSDGQASWNAAAAAMLALWNQQLVRSTFLWVNDSTAPVASGNLANNVIFAADNFGRDYGDSTLAVTTSWRLGTRIIEADVSFNTKYKWDSYRGALRGTSGVNAEFSRVALHEFGHVIGLSHPDQAGQFVSAVMNSTAGDIDNLTADDKAGAAFLYAANDGATAPSILIPLYNQSPVKGDSVEFAVSASGSAPFSYQWRRNNVVQGVSTASFILSNVASASAGTWTVTVTNSKGSASSSMVLTVTDTYVAPTISTQPASATSLPGRNVVFSVAATGSTPRIYQWKKDGANYGTYSGSDTLTIADVQPSDAGRYSVLVSNNGGSVTSAEAVLTVSAGTSAPAFATAPASQTISPGSTVVFSATATGTPAPSLQWQRNGAPVPGATQSTLVLTAATAAQAGTYTCVATNSAGSVTSSPATLAVSTTAAFGRLINLSILTPLTAAEGFFTLGASIGGAGTSGPKPLLVRAAGPALAGFGGDFLPDPRLELFSGPTSVAANDNWGGTTLLANAFAAVGAFNYASASSKDAAVFKTDATGGGYTVRISDTGGAAGRVIAEVYDATPAADFTATTPRLINVAVLKQINPGSILTAGFVIGGSTARTVLVRAIGPGLAPLGVTGVLPDPKLELFAGSAVIAANDNWGGDAQLTAVGRSVGAFAIADLAGKDAMILVTLAPGSYTTQLTGVANGSGQALVEVYEVP